MNANQPITTPSYGYDGIYASFQATSPPFFGYDVAANWFAAISFEDSSGNGANSRQYTGKERDVESGLDYFGARYYGSALGRFTSPDEPFADQEPDDPQSWNLYAYVRNGPLTSIDPTGREEKHCDSDGNNCKFETTVTDTAVQILFAPMIAMNRTVDQTQQALQHVADWASQPRNPVR